MTFTVLMEGTSNPMNAVTTQIALFSRLCIAEPLPSDGKTEQKLSAGHYKVSFAGCGVSHGMVGTLFAVGLREQCEVICSYVDAFLAEGLSVKLNFVGLSRGGIGGLYLAQQLTDLVERRGVQGNLVANLLLFDPVPGNLVWMARFLDWGGQMNTNQAMDVSACPVLGRVVVLYPCEPLPAIAFHAPLVATFPKTCQVEADVILGCHQGALWLRPQADTCLSFARIRDFLQDCGSKLDCSKSLARELNVPDTHLAELLEEELGRASPQTRCAHAASSGMSIVRHDRGTYLNRSHEALLRRLKQQPRADAGSTCPKYMLDFAR